jgi:hypothetical protein
MSGSRIDAAKQTMLRLLQLLPKEHCLFNIIGFGSNHQSLFPNSVPVNQNNMEIAVNHCNTLDADFGGIYSP